MFLSKYKKTLMEVPLILMLAFIIILALTIYQAGCAPAKFPIHWNALGEIDGWASKTFVVWFFPLMALGFYFLMLLIPRIDPLKKNYASFEVAFYLIRLWLMIFLLVIFVITFLAGWGYFINPASPIIILIGLLFITLGLTMPRIKQNYFFGIRTPWTLYSQDNWVKTHQLAGKTFVVGGVLSVLAMFLPAPLNFYIFIIVIMLAGLWPVIYSYLISRQKKV
ncbi:MAG: SdpI family protein [Candidatus Gribaldobacteria bacterium]|nr:SdpI family protein [Candidatus Gribaldobacteria bacterium]